MSNKLSSNKYFLDVKNVSLEANDNFFHFSRQNRRSNEIVFVLLMEFLCVKYTGYNNENIVHIFNCSPS